MPNGIHVPIATDPDRENPCEASRTCPFPSGGNRGRMTFAPLYWEMHVRGMFSGVHECDWKELRGSSGG